MRKLLRYAYLIIIVNLLNALVFSLFLTPTLSEAASKNSQKLVSQKVDSRKVKSSKADSRKTENISITHFKERRTTGIYFDRFSYLHGETMTYFANCDAPTYNFAIYRVNDFYISAGDKVFSATDLTCPNSAAEPTQWSSTQVPNSLAPGVYLGQIKDSLGYESFAPFVIPDEKVTHAGIAVVPFQTLYAYNLWSGKSAYKGDGDFAHRDRIIYFHQPLELKSGLAKFVSYVAPVVGEIENKHYDVSYVADTELSGPSNPLLGHKAYISMGHDEYWSTEERNDVLAARDSGTNLIFLGANVAYWNIRLAQNGNQPTMEIYKSATEDPDKTNPTIRFIDLGKPESELTGLEYKCFPVTGDFQAKTPDNFVFSGVDAKEIAKYPKLVGPEIDGLTTGDHGFTGKMEDLATANVSCSVKGRPLITTADIVYGVSPNNAGTVAIGSMSWVGIGLRSTTKTSIGAFTHKVTDNILAAALQDKLGVSHPLNH
jgi:hypothetical protein